MKPMLTFLLITIFLIVDVSAQFFFPFAMGQPPYRYQQATGYQYYNRNGVKDSEGFFARCSGWTCTSNT
uniref:Uncharacterized protein n=1 Tax=Caenorhabditis japonica TaxID=281687 RepID=A0A8R1ET36_CAEJA